jgi:hypothetical protein
LRPGLVDLVENGKVPRISIESGMLFCYYCCYCYMSKEWRDFCKPPDASVTLEGLWFSGTFGRGCEDAVVCCLVFFFLKISLALTRDGGTSGRSAFPLSTLIERGGFSRLCYYREVRAFYFMELNV